MGPEPVLRSRPPLDNVHRSDDHTIAWTHTDAGGAALAGCHVLVGDEWMGYTTGTAFVLDADASRAAATAQVVLVPVRVDGWQWSLADCPHC